MSALRRPDLVLALAATAAVGGVLFATAGCDRPASEPRSAQGGTSPTGQTGTPSDDGEATAPAEATAGDGPAEADGPAEMRRPSTTFGVSLGTVALDRTSRRRVALGDRPDASLVATLVFPNPAPVDHGLPSWAVGTEVRLTFHGDGPRPLSHFGGPLAAWTWRDLQVGRTAELRFEGGCAGGERSGAACAWPAGATELEIAVESAGDPTAPEASVVMTGTRP